MPKLWNTDHQHAIVDPDKPGIAPGASHEFTDEQIEAGLSGSWSETDPRAGLADEQLFKRLRDASRAELDDEARALGLDPAGLTNKQAVVQAIREAHAAQDDDGTDDVPDDDTTDPAERPE